MTRPLPEPDFVLDSGRLRCYYGGTVAKLLAADARVAEAQADAAAREIERLVATLTLQQASYEREIALDVSAERERCIATLRALTDDSGVNDDGQAWLRRLTRGDCVSALMALGA